MSMIKVVDPLFLYHKPFFFVKASEVDDDCKLTKFSSK
jgi:hypothetical protein